MGPTLTPDAQEMRGHLVATQLNLAFGGLAVLKSVSVTVEAALTTGIIGLNGSGKTSLLNCINGIYRPQSGTVVLDGSDVTSLSSYRRTALGIARTFQHNEAPRGQRAIDYVMLGCYPLRRRLGAGFAGLGLSWIKGLERADRSRAERAIARVKLPDVGDSLVGELPYGVIKRLDLARALASSPRLLLLDEPAAGLSAPERLELIDVLRELKAAGQTMCLIEHDMGLIASLCDRVLVLSSGEKVADSEAKELMSNPEIKSAFLGE